MSRIRTVFVFLKVDLEGLFLKFWELDELLRLKVSCSLVRLEDCQIKY